MRKKQKKPKKQKPIERFALHMRKKLFVMFAIVLIALFALIGRLAYIEYTSGDRYEKKVLSMLSYDSSTIPYQRGNIMDRNGTVLATSVPVYNVIMDCSQLTAKEEYLEPTMAALATCFPEIDLSSVRSYAAENKTSKYYVLAKRLPYEQIQQFVALQEEKDEHGKTANPYIKGIWFEKEYQRYYPFGQLASSVIGFSTVGDLGVIGLENFYNDTLNGINGRMYGYLNSDSDFEKTVVPAEDGNHLVVSIDANIQSVVEQKILEFNEAFRDNFREGPGSLNTAVLIMNPKNGEIYACAEYPTFDLNEPRDLSLAYSDAQIEEMDDDATMDALNKLWQNYSITMTYEPGSVQKSFTIAGGLETGTLTEDMTFECDGGEYIAGYNIRCVKRTGHGVETLADSLRDSCNDALMQMSYLIGPENFTKFQSIFGFGQRVGIDIPGEANTAPLVHSLENMSKINLATSSFGQTFNCTMLQMATAFSSLINGGKYYQPHFVTKVVDSDGNTVQKMDRLLVKQTVSEQTSRTMRDYLYSVVTEGSGKTAKVDGYSLGGKTGTAQKFDEETHKRKENCYLVSFIGFAPYDDPELVIYCIIDEPNVEDEAHSYYAQNVVREILKEIYPYLNIYPDEELTGINANKNIKGEIVTDNPQDPAGTDEEQQGENTAPVIEDENPGGDESGDIFDPQ